MEDIVKHLEASGLHAIIIDEHTVFPEPAPAIGDDWREVMRSAPMIETSAPAQSPFLPRTSIRFAWDSTTLGAFKTCPRMYQYLYIDGWAPKDENIHLRFGIEYHQALHDYETSATSGGDHEQSVRFAIRELLIRCQDYPNVDPTARPSIRVKTKTNLVRTVVWYLDQFKDDPAETVVIDNEWICTKEHHVQCRDGAHEGCPYCTHVPKPAMEVSFKFELDWGPGPFNGLFAEGVEGASKFQPYILCGHLDRLVTFNDETFVMDRKTATTTLSSSYFDQYHPNNQMTLYAIAGQVVLGTAIRGVIIDGACIQVGGSWFQRGFTYRTQAQLDEWMVDLRFWLEQAERYAVAGHFPMNDTACNNYGGCKFRDICNKDPRVRENFLRAKFVQLPLEERWNPLRSRG